MCDPFTYETLETLNNDLVASDLSSYLQGRTTGSNDLAASLNRRLRDICVSINLFMTVYFSDQISLFY